VLSCQTPETLELDLDCMSKLDGAMRCIDSPSDHCYRHPTGVGGRIMHTGRSLSAEGTPKESPWRIPQEAQRCLVTILVFAAACGVSLWNLYFNPRYWKPDARSAARHVNGVVPRRFGHDWTRLGQVPFIGMTVSLMGRPSAQD
jgi:hypothetical protein